MAKFLKIALLIGAMGMVGGCHFGTADDEYDYAAGYGSHRGSYRDGFRDGRAYERRRSEGRYSRYDDWRDYLWRRR